MKLNAPDGHCPVPQAHHLALGGFRGDFEFSRERAPLDQKGMVACAGKPLRKAPEDIGVLVQDRRCLAVHHAPGLHDLAAKEMPHSLMPKAHTEYGPSAGE